MPTLDPANDGFLEHRFIPMMGVNMDTVGYSRKQPDAQQDVQRRLHDLTKAVLNDIDLRFDELPYGMSGDGLYFLLPPTTDPTHALPGILSAAAKRLAVDNRRFTDQIRLRMSVGFGLAKRGPNGTVGGLIIDLSRLVDCDPIRKAIDEFPRSDLAVLISGGLYEMVHRSGCLPDGFAFSQVDIVMKSKAYTASAWLWVCPPGQVHAA